LLGYEGKKNIDFFLGTGILKELRAQTPRNDRGHLKHKLFQRLTEMWATQDCENI